MASVHFDPQDGLLQSFIAAGPYFRQDSNQALAAVVASKPSWARRELLSWLARRGGQDDSRRMAARTFECSRFIEVASISRTRCERH